MLTVTSDLAEMHPLLPSLDQPPIFVLVSVFEVFVIAELRPINNGWITDLACNSLAPFLGLVLQCPQP